MTKSLKKYFIFSFTTIILLSCSNSNHTEVKDNWKQVDEIIKRIVPPTFRDKIFDITQYGAVGDGKSDCTASFKLAIDECVKSGGGKVVVPAGVYLSGSIHLKSNVNLYLEKDAVIKFSTDPRKYLPLVFTRWEGVECMNYSSLIYAYGQENIAISGGGILDGQGSNANWWSWKGKEEFGWKAGMPYQKNARDKLFEMGENNIPVEQRVLGEGNYLRPNFIQFYNCKNVLIDGVTLKDSPMWFINPVLCRNLSVINVKIEGLGPNNDGCNPESSKDVLIKDCYFNNGDDCIAIKSGRNNDGRRINIPSENIIVKNCKMKNGHGGVVLGSEISGGVKNVFVEGCQMDSPNLDRAIRIKTNSVRGGVLENIFVRNLSIGEVSEAILKIDFYYEEGDVGKFTPSVNNIVLENIKSEKSAYAIWIKAYERAKIKNLVIKDSKFDNVANENVLESVDEIILSNVTINKKVIN
jgi:polygalacturonase